MAGCIRGQAGKVAQIERASIMLWEAELEKAVIIDKTYVDDGRGGVTPTYKDGVSIDAAFSFTASEQMRIAEAAQAVPRYVITTRQNINLQYHDVIRRERDKKIFRITSDGDDNKSPEVSSLYMRQVEAEEWELPNG